MIHKIISLFMSVIMLVTALPVLQAADFATSLNISELNELKQDLALLDDKVQFNVTSSIPSVKEIEARYNTAIANYKNNLETFGKDKTGREIEEYAEYIEFMKKEAKKRATNNSRYDGFKSEEEKEYVAFYDILTKEFQKAKDYTECILKEEKGSMDNKRGCYMMGGVIVGVVLWAALESVLAELACVVGGVCVIGGLCLAGLVQPSRPYFAPGLLPDQAFALFLEAPFEHLKKFNKGGVNDFELFYTQYGDECAEILNDVVDIEYYTSLYPTIENMQERMYANTAEWRISSTQDRAEHIRNLARNLRNKYGTK